MLRTRVVGGSCLDVLRSRIVLAGWLHLDLMLGFISGYTLRFTFGFTSPWATRARLAHRHGDFAPRSVADIFI